MTYKYIQVTSPMIRVRGSIGSDIHKAAEEAVKMANELRTEVSLSFNDRIISVIVDDDPKRVSERYFACDYYDSWKKVNN